MRRHAAPKAASSHFASMQGVSFRMKQVPRKRRWKETVSLCHRRATQTHSITIVFNYWANTIFLFMLIHIGVSVTCNQKHLIKVTKNGPGPREHLPIQYIPEERAPSNKASYSLIGVTVMWTIGRLRTGSSPKCLWNGGSWNHGTQGSMSGIDKVGENSCQEQMKKTTSWWWVCLSDGLSRPGAGCSDSLNEVITFFKQQDTAFPIFLENTWLSRQNRCCVLSIIRHDSGE